MNTYEQLAAYAESHCEPESEAVKHILEMSREELAYTDILSGRQVVNLLRILIRIGGLSSILEVGMFTGYATLSMAEVLPEGGRITALEMNTRYEAVAERGFAAARKSVRDKIQIIHGNARESCHDLRETFDLIFLDADKQFYPQYYEILKPKLCAGGLLVVDNVFWHGGVLEEPEAMDRKSRAIHALNQRLLTDTDMQTVMLDIRDGLSISRKRGL
jgi:caffeoyl-CoA O-methyltransferase